MKMIIMILIMDKVIIKKKEKEYNILRKDHNNNLNINKIIMKNHNSKGIIKRKKITIIINMIKIMIEAFIKINNIDLILLIIDNNF